MQGQLCFVGTAPNEKRVFFYGVSHGLHVEIIDRRDKSLKHLVQLVDIDGVPIPIPSGARFQHVASEHGSNLLENHVRKLERHAQAPVLAG